VYTGGGYAVVAINFHGSKGFGQKFTDSISKNWAESPLEDLMKGLDYAIQHYNFLDGNRVAALGGSYGGWMTNWINGHTNRFKALVTHCGIFEMRSMALATEELWFPEWEFNGLLWEKPELYETFSPSRYVQNWQTPTLIIHGSLDYRVPEIEGISAFTALQRKNIPSELLIFPDEGHWILKPQNSITWYTTVLGWLNRWCK